MNETVDLDAEGLPDDNLIDDISLGYNIQTVQYILCRLEVEASQNGMKCASVDSVLTNEARIVCVRAQNDCWSFERHPVLTGINV